MSVGLQYTTPDVWALFGAVMCHEVVIGFSLGLQFIKNMFSTKRILIIAALCSIIMPIGKVQSQLSNKFLWVPGSGRPKQIQRTWPDLT